MFRIGNYCKYISLYSRKSRKYCEFSFVLLYFPFFLQQKIYFFCDQVWIPSNGRAEQMILNHASYQSLQLSVYIKVFNKHVCVIQCCRNWLFKMSSNCKWSTWLLLKDSVIWQTFGIPSSMDYVVILLVRLNLIVTFFIIILYFK